MSWKVKYWARLIIEKVLCVLKLENVQESVKFIVGRSTKIDENFILLRVDGKLESIDRIMKNRKISVIHEQGTGWHGIDLIVFYLKGLRVYTTDVRDLLDFELMKTTVSTISSNVDRYGEYRDKIAKLKRLLSKQDLSRNDFLKEINIDYRVGENFDFSGVSNIDLFYSDSVLQRMKTDDLCGYILNSQKVASPRALHHHRVDCKDFFSIGKEHVIPPLYYLTISDWLWEFVTCKRLNYQNRLRMPEFIGMFESAGFVCDVFEVDGKDEYLQFVKINKDKIRSSNILPELNVAITSFTLSATSVSE